MAIGAYHFRLSEVYTSIQGEGPNVGKATQFVRFAGCNLKCPGWPCDTQHAIDPKLYRQEWQRLTLVELLAKIQPYPRRITFTGGEPLLQGAPAMEELALILLEAGHRLDMFTNGTFRFPLWARSERVQKIMDWKLPDSGEDCENEDRLRNVPFLMETDAIKFVCASKDDFNVAIDLAEEHVITKRSLSILPHLYMGAAWGKVSEKDLVEWMLEAKLDPEIWKLNVQVHNYIWPRDERAR